MTEEKVLCQTPTPGKKPTRNDTWKYDLVRSAVLASIPEGGVEFKGLPELVKGQLTSEELDRLGSVSCYTITVKLDLEVKGEIERVPDSTPQLLRKT